MRRHRESDTETMRCISCKEMHTARDAGTCKECYEGASETEEELKREIEDLKAKVAFYVNHSPVFKAMLENEMEESKSGTIKISDVSYDALRAFVNYLYTAESWLDEQMACDLLVLTEKYQHGAKLLLDAALCLIMDNIDKLTKKEGYMELVEKDPRLVMEIYEASLSKQVNTAVLKDASIKS
ncbi:hypothetical protein V6Z12_A02G085500 [Gossypium hirsutum]|uniref:BTB domain-containing protein n=1 Tax=Gossypium darwinii TaxID=34276 RepID=A0A5D2HBI7_GOSDA|nr:hypothetical protein ES288_A02G084900v1 [Gossypium darwinii]